MNSFFKTISKICNKPYFLLSVIAFDSLYTIFNIIKHSFLIGLIFLAVNIIFLIFTSKKYSFYIIFFLYPLARVLKLPNIETSLFTVLICVFYLTLIMRLLLSKAKITSEKILVICLFAIYCIFTSIISFTNSKDFRILSLISYYVYLVFPIIAFVCVNHDNDIDGVNNIIFCSGAYLFGLLVTIFFYKFFPNGSNLLKDSGVNVFEMGAAGIRFSPLTDDPNYGTALILLLSSLFVCAKKTSKQSYVGYPIIVLSLGISMLSLSKMFILGVALILCCFIIKFMKQIKSLWLNSIIVLACVLGLLIFVASDIGNSIIIRTIGVRDGIDLNRITSGRTDIFGEYSSYILSNPIVVLFGKGPLFQDLTYFSNGEHNTFTKNIFGSGIVGVSIMLLIFIIMAKNRLKPISSLPKNIHLIGFFGCLIICCMTLGLAPSTVFPIFVVSSQFIIFQNNKNILLERIDI